MAAEGLGIGLGLLEVLNAKIESNNLIFIVIVISIVQFVFYLTFLHIRDNIYRKVLLDWVKGHEAILRDQFFRDNVMIEAIVDERTLGLTIKLNRVINALISLSFMFGGIQFLQIQRSPVGEQQSWEILVDQAYRLKVNNLKENISQWKVSAEKICSATRDEESCGATVLLDKATKELAELEKYSDRNTLLPGEMFRLLSIETSKRKSEDISVRSALVAETAERKTEDSLLSAAIGSIRTGPKTLRISDNWILQEEGDDESKPVLCIRRWSPSYTGPDTRVALHPDLGEQIDLRDGALFINSTNILSTILNWSGQQAATAVKSQLVINNLVHHERIINLAEVQLFRYGNQIPNYLLACTLSTTHSIHVASRCNDGSLSNFCHTWDRDDPDPSLTIVSDIVFDKVVVYNRKDNQDRIQGATITATINGQSKATTFPSSPDSVFTFLLTSAGLQHQK